MKITDLNKINIDDLKNLDWGSVKGRLFGRPTVIINIFLIVITVTVAFWAYRMFTGTMRSQKLKVIELQKKMDALENLKATQKQYDAVVKNMPESITENKLIALLSEIALKRGVQIVSFSQADKKNNDFVSLVNFKITITAENYANIIRFMYDIENSTYSIRFGGWSGVTKILDRAPHLFPQRPTVRKREKIVEKEFIEAVIEIEIMDFKHG